MNPQQPTNPGMNLNGTPGINLPPPSFDLPPQATPQPLAEQPASAPVSPEQATPVDTTPSAQLVADPAPLASTPQPAAPASTSHNDVTATTQSVVPSVLEDKDLIEKEWVNKAKAIVERNRDDPYKQSEELTEVRADYLQKNYNKTIKSGK